MASFPRRDPETQSFLAHLSSRYRRHIIRVPCSGKAQRKQDRKTTPVDRVAPFDSKRDSPLPPSFNLCEQLIASGFLSPADVSAN